MADIETHSSIDIPLATRLHSHLQVSRSLSPQFPSSPSSSPPASYRSSWIQQSRKSHGNDDVRKNTDDVRKIADDAAKMASSSPTSSTLSKSILKTCKSPKLVHRQRVDFRPAVHVFEFDRQVGDLVGFERKNLSAKVDCSPKRLNKRDASKGSKDDMSYQPTTLEQPARQDRVYPFEAESIYEDRRDRSDEKTRSAGIPLPHAGAMNAEEVKRHTSNPPNTVLPIGAENKGYDNVRLEIMDLSNDLFLNNPEILHAAKSWLNQPGNNADPVPYCNTDQFGNGNKINVDYKAADLGVRKSAEKLTPHKAPTTDNKTGNGHIKTTEELFTNNGYSIPHLNASASNQSGSKTPAKRFSSFNDNIEFNSRAAGGAHPSSGSRPAASINSQPGFHSLIYNHAGVNSAEYYDRQASLGNTGRLDNVPATIRPVYSNEMNAHMHKNMNDDVVYSQHQQQSQQQAVKLKANNLNGQVFRSELNHGPQRNALNNPAGQTHYGSMNHGNSVHNNISYNINNNHNREANLNGDKNASLPSGHAVGSAPVQIPAAPPLPKQINQRDIIHLEEPLETTSTFFEDDLRKLWLRTVIPLTDIIPDDIEVKAEPSGDQVTVTYFRVLPTNRAKCMAKYSLMMDVNPFMVLAWYDKSAFCLNVDAPLKFG